MNLFRNPNRLAENYGIKIAAGLIVFFLLMKVLNLHHIVWLRFFNLFILTAGILMVLKRFRSTHNDSMSYFRGLIMGVAASGIASVLFGLFLFVYMQADSELMISIKENEPMGRHLNPYIAGFIVALEGFFSGFLATFVLLNWVTTDEVNVSHQ